VFVVSDLHLGGPPEPAGSELAQHTDPCVRRFCEFGKWLAARPEREKRDVHLVLNGDVVDFLAVEPFVAFRAHDRAATEKLERIFERSGEVWDALSSLLASGISMTLLLGNTDLELSFPGPRRLLLEKLGPGRIDFIYDNQAFSMGPLLVEHGNRYDRVHAVPHNKLRHVRSNLSRREPPRKLPNVPGRELVANVSNALKKRGCSFLDMVKPESAAVIFLLGAVESEALERTQVRNLIRTMLRPAGNYVDPSLYQDAEEDRFDSMEHPAVAEFERSLSQVDTPNPMSAWLGRSFGAGKRSARIEAVERPEQLLAQMLGVDGVSDGDTSPGSPSDGRGEHDEEKPSFWERWNEIRRGDRGALGRYLLTGLRSVARSHHAAWDTGREDTGYVRAADASAKEGFKVVVYGHTHLPKQLSLPRRNAVYLNTGSWTPKVKLPASLWSDDDEEAVGSVLEVLADWEEQNLEPYVEPGSTFARIDLDGGEVERASLHRFDSEGAEPMAD
jgi:UDP-2,3-diacylglucosamine pyrophosphatase LpxH